MDGSVNIHLAVQCLFEPLIFPEYNQFIPWEHPDAVEAAIRMVTDRLSQRSDQ